MSSTNATESNNGVQKPLTFSARATGATNELENDVNVPLKLSNKLLAQAEGAHIDFYTINFARLVCQDIHVAAQGQRLYNHCFSNLPVYRAVDDRLQFGWGERHLFRNFGVQLYEYEHLLLASALGEYFSEDYAAAVFSALAECHEDDDRPQPHLSSWRNFVHINNGILATSDFSIVVDDRVRMSPYRNHDDGMPFARQSSEKLSIIKLSEALCMLGELRIGHAKELTLAGGDVLGWFSAFTDLCLGIDVALVDQDGKELHRANANATSRLTLMFTPPDAARAQQDSSVIWLTEETSNTLAPSLHTGRVTPHALCNKVFGPAFHRLDQVEAKTFANALGGLARVLELSATGDTVLPIMSAEKVPNPGAWGLGLIQTWTNWFPELRHLQGRMERALKLDQEACRKLCEDSILHLEPACGCYICSAAKGSENSPINLPKDGFCLPTLMETIIMLGLALSRVTLTPNLFPSRAGVLAMYRSQMRKRLEMKRIHATGWERHKILFGNDWNPPFSKRLPNVIALFSSSWPRVDIPENLYGISHQGICAYSLKLERGDMGKPHPDDHVIRVVNGSMNWRQKVLNRVCLGPVEVGPYEESWESIKAEHLKERLFVK